MNRAFYWAGALLAAAPLFSQVLEPKAEIGKLVWFSLTETREQVARLMGAPLLGAEFGEDFIGWQYRIGESPDEEPSHSLVFRKSSGELISVTRNYGSEHDVDALFPIAETATYEYRGQGRERMPVRVRKLYGGKLLLAVGAAKPGDRTRQLVLVRDTELRYFYPWLEEAMRTVPTK